MSIFFQTGGILTTIQDLGRAGFRRFGINPNGAMDRTAVRLINVLLGNNENEAVLEMHFPAPEILFETDAEIALGGADFKAKSGEQSLNNWQIISIKKGSLLEFENKKFGNRAYLAVKGGFKATNWLGSASTNLLANVGGFNGRALQRGDRISFNQDQRLESENRKFRISHSLIPFYSRFPTIRVTTGADFSLLTALSEQHFLKGTFTVSANSDRMGFRLQGEPLFLLSENEMLSSGVNFGTIQLVPGGQMIVLMADHQTTGGYPRIAHVIERDLPVLAQLGANDKVCFHLVSIEEAEHLVLDFEKNLRLLRTGCKLTWNK